MSPGAESRRLFFALWPSAEIRSEIIRRRASIDSLSRKRVPDHNLHLTLLFLGDQPADDLDAIVKTAVGVQAPKFELVLDRFGWFARARVAWLGGRPPNRGKALVADLMARMGALELDFERRAWAPHVTLFRKVSGRPELPEVEPLSWPVDRFALIESVPGKPYAALEHFSLG